jgi:hypothetical protein
VSTVNFPHSPAVNKALDPVTANQHLSGREFAPFALFLLIMTKVGLDVCLGFVIVHHTDLLASGQVVLGGLFLDH